MPSYKLTIAYDGTHYCGFQIQPNGPTIQGKLMDAASELFGQDVTITGASRTDSGVHAKGQVVCMVTKKAIDSKKIPLALNRRLPEDIVIIEAVEVPADWHPRYQSHKKTYEYKLYNGRIQYPQDKRDSYHYRQELDLDKMKQGAALMVGTHDFKSYASAKKEVVDTVRTVTEIVIEKTNQMIHIKVTGKGFLYNMVRIMVGTLIEVGLGRRTLASVEKSLIKGDRSLAGKTAPSKGLTLVSIEYESDSKVVLHEEARDEKDK